MAFQAIATLPALTPVPICAGWIWTTGAVESTSTQHCGGSPGAGGWSPRPEAERATRHNPNVPSPPKVDLDRRDAVLVAAAANPGSAAILGDPELDGRRTAGPGVLDRILQLEFRACDQKRLARRSARRARRRSFAPLRAPGAGEPPQPPKPRPPAAENRSSSGRSDPAALRAPRAGCA